MDDAMGAMPSWAVNGLANMPFSQGLSDAAAGFGDNLSMGLSEWAREGLGSNDQVDKCSDAYSGGDTAGEYFDRLNPKGWAKAGAKELGAKVASKTLRGLWEKHYGKSWPKDATGRNHDAHHKRAMADGGAPKDPRNITPLERSAHRQHHMDNGDFKRWGSR